MVVMTSAVQRFEVFFSKFGVNSAPNTSRKRVQFAARKLSVLCRSRSHHLRLEGSSTKPCSFKRASASAYRGCSREGRVSARKCSEPSTMKGEKEDVFPASDVSVLRDGGCW